MGLVQGNSFSPIFSKLYFCERTETPDLAGRMKREKESTYSFGKCNTEYCFF